MAFENATAQSHEPMAVHSGIAEDKRKALSDGLAKVLADTYTLLGKTHGFHWNVTGVQFHSLHEMFEEQYTDLTTALDYFAPGSLSQFLKLSTIEDEHGVPDARGMLEQLVRDNETVTQACQAVVGIYEEANDTVTEDLMNHRMDAHDKAAWMLHSSMS